MDPIAPIRRPVLGLESGHTTVVPYHPEWPTLFEGAAAEIRGVLGHQILGIEHVGSTAVPGLAAKPILDILVAVSDFQKALKAAPLLADLGYEHRPDEESPDRHFFRRRVDGRRTHHLSLAEPTSSHYRNTIVFRDALRADPRLAKAYEALKLDLANRFPHDREAYSRGKTQFVVDVLRASGGA